MSPICTDGRHGAAWNRGIVDFTKKKDAELLEHLHHHAGKIFGHFTANLLDRPLISKRTAKRGGFTAIAASFVIVLAAQQLSEVQLPNPVKTEQAWPQQPEKVVDTEPVNSIRTISGRIINRKTKEPVSYGRVSVKGTIFVARCGENGVFTLKIPADKMKELPLTLEVNDYGFRKQEFEMPERVRVEDIALLPFQYKLKRKKEEGIKTICPHF